MKALLLRWPRSEHEKAAHGKRAKEVITVSREKALFRDNLERLRELFPGVEVLTMEETCKLLRMDRRTLLADKSCPARKVAGKYIVPIVKLASYLS